MRRTVQVARAAISLCSVAALTCLPVMLPASASGAVDALTLRAAARTRSSVAPSGVRPAYAAPDAYETDDTWQTAKTVLTNGTEQQHTFYSGDTARSASDRQWDDDWLKFTPTTDHTYHIVAYGDAAGCDPVLEAGTLMDGRDFVYDDDWSTNDPDSLVHIYCDDGDTVYIHIANWTAFDGHYHVFVVDEGELAAGSVERMDGANRYAVAKNVAYRQFGNTWGPHTNVIITSGLDRSACDPLAASALAGTLDCPLLLINQDSGTHILPTDTKNAIISMRNANPGYPIKFWIVGGTASVPDWVKTRIKAIVSNAVFERLSGPDRYSTAAKVAARVRGLSPSPWVFIANGETSSYFYSALAAGPVCYHNKIPLVLTRKGSVPSATSGELTAGGYAGKYVVGCQYEVTGGTVSTLGATRALWGPWPYSGYNRYWLARTFAEWASAGGLAHPPAVAVASKLPDALTGGCLAGNMGGVLLYTHVGGSSANPADEQVEAWAHWRREAGGADFYICGGAASISGYSYNWFEYLNGGWAPPTLWD